MTSMPRQHITKKRSLNTFGGWVSFTRRSLWIRLIERSSGRDLSPRSSGTLSTISRELSWKSTAMFWSSSYCCPMPTRPTRPLCRRVATAGNPAWTDLGPAPARSWSCPSQTSPGRIVPDQNLGGAGPPEADSGHRKIDVLPHRRQHGAASGARVQPHQPRDAAPRRDRYFGNDHHPDQAAGAGTLRVLSNVGNRDDPGQGAQALAALPDPSHAREVISPRRHQPNEELRGRHGRGDR